MSGFHQGRPPRNKGLRYPPDPPTVEEIIAVMRVAGDRPDGLRLRGVIVVLRRAGLRISEALALQESDLDRTRGAVLVRRGKGGKRRGSEWTVGPGSSSSRGSASATGCR
jgi:integrase